jgi:copper chaperone
MEKSVIKVDGMSCDHCVMTVKKAVTSLPGIDSVDVNLESGLVTIEYTPAQSSLDSIKNAIVEKGYEVVA